MGEAVRVETENHTMIITIDRPDARNAVDRAVAEGIGAALDDLDARDELRVGILTGAGGTFSAGMDLKAFLRGELPVADDRGFAGVSERSCAKPLIAAVEGAALAGGCEIVLACDLVVVAEGASLGLPEVQRGLAAGGGGLYSLWRRIPYHRAMEIVLTGDPISGLVAYELGLANRVVPDGGALEAALELAERIGANAPLAVRASKQVVVDSQDWRRDEATERSAAILVEVFLSEDAREGARAFAEKREPQWRNR